MLILRSIGCMVGILTVPMANARTYVVLSARYILIGSWRSSVAVKDYLDPQITSVQAESMYAFDDDGR